MSHPDQHYGDKSYSQHGEDLLIVNIFKILGVEKPSYIDIGAHHPVNISNTALLYERGSRGMNVEPNPSMIKLFTEGRKEDLNLNCAVMPIPGYYEYLMYDSWSGLNTFREGRLSLVADKKLIKAITMSEIAEVFCRTPDVLFTDVEGYDLEILGTMPAHFRPTVICSEIGPDEPISFFLTNFGYQILCRMGANLVMVRNDKILYLLK